MPPYSASDRLTIQSRDGNFNDRDSVPEWDTVLPWTTSTPTPPETPPTGPTTPAQNAVLDSTTYRIEPVYADDTYGPSRIMPFVRATPGSPKIVARFFVNRTRTYVDIDSQGNRSPSNPPQIRDRMPHAGGAGATGTLQLVSDNRSRPYPEGTPPDGSGASIVPGWPIVEADPFLAALGQYPADQANVHPVAFLVDPATLANSTIIGGDNTKHGGITAAAYRPQDHAAFAIRGGNQLCTVTLKTSTPRDMTVTDIGNPIRLTTNPVVIPTAFSLMVEPGTNQLIAVGNVTLTTTPTYTFATYIYRINETNPDQSTSLGTLTNNLSALFVVGANIFGVNTSNSHLVRLTISGNTVTETDLGAITDGPGNFQYHGAAVVGTTVYIIDLRGTNFYRLDVGGRRCYRLGELPATLRTSRGTVFTETTALINYGGVTDFYKPEIIGPRAPAAGAETTQYGAGTGIWELQINPGTGGDLEDQPAVGTYDNLQLTVEYVEP